MLNRRALLPFTILLASCASTRPPAEAQGASSPPIASAPAPAPAAPAASPLLAAVPVNATLVVRLDGRALRAAPLYAQAMASLQAFEGAQRRLDELNHRCGVNLLDAVDEVVLARTGLSDEDDVTLARVRAGDAQVLGCLASLLDGQAATFAGAPSVRFEADHVSSVAVVVEGVTVIGTEGKVSAAIKAIRAHDRAAAKPARAIDVGPAAVLSFALSGPGYGSFSAGAGVVELDARHLALRGELGLGSPAEANALLAEARGQIDRGAKELDGLPPAVGKQLHDYLDRLHLSADGSRVLGALELEGGAEAQVQLIGTLSAVSIFATRQYISQSKLVEARSTVGAISRDLASYMESEDSKGKRPTRFPPSAPPTPAKVPSGVKYQPDGSTWSHPTWRAIRFEMSTPSYYSYEIITSKDGRAATVRAHGDLDGDGKLSTIERTLTLGKDGTVVMAPKLVLQDELE